ncbi:MAG: class I SAM-dependent methyltransferase [Acidimicrobiia bacterium]
MIRKILSSLRGRRATPASPDDSIAARDYFTQVYQQNYWGGDVSKSGVGSEGDFAKQKANLAKAIIAEYGISSIVDLGCGDFNWMKDLTPQIQRYHGVDVVPELVRSNVSRFSAPHISFQCLDLSDPEEQQRLTVRQADLVMCLDVFGHLLNKEVDSLLRFVLHDMTTRFFLVTNRREPGSDAYLRREKNRMEGIDLEHHPLFREHRPRRLKQTPALFPNDFFDLYEIAGRGTTPG